MKRVLGALVLLATGCGGVAGEDLFADTPSAPPAWVCPIGEQDCGGAMPPLDLSPEAPPSAPSKATTPRPAAEPPPELMLAKQIRSPRPTAPSAGSR